MNNIRLNCLHMRFSPYSFLKHFLLPNLTINWSTEVFSVKPDYIFTLISKKLCYSYKNNILHMYTKKLSIKVNMCAEEIRCLNFSYIFCTNIHSFINLFMHTFERLIWSIYHFFSVILEAI